MPCFLNQSVSALRTFEHLVLTPEISLLAADLSIQYGLAVADSLVLAHARLLGVPLVTLDNDFNFIPGVISFAAVNWPFAF